MPAGRRAPVPAADGSGTTTVDVWLRGIVRRRYLLTHPDGEDLSAIRLGPRGGEATLADGSTWALGMTFEGEKATRVTTARRADGREIVVEETGRRGRGMLRTGGQHLSSTIRWDGGRTAWAREEDGTVVVDARWPGIRRGPFARITVADTVPEATGVALLHAFALLWAHEDLRGAAARTGGDGGGG